ncbi:CDP-alcohol phosphatidyltransferase family protein [Candidatus Woesearchaeota archaeon]|nr:CDP-alcohol phosphatidyltransferase family protein [Candidatus Woesearchaeota archaeon]
MVSFRELRDKYQIPRVKKIKLGWWGRYILNPPSVVIAQLLMPFRITPNQITVVWLLMGLAGGILFSFGDYWKSIIAALIFQLTIVFDGVDGLIARYKKLSSPSGEYFESVTHTLVHDIFIVVGITFGAYNQTGNILMFALGFSMVISLLLHKFLFLEKIHLFVKNKLFSKVKKTQKKIKIHKSHLTLLKKIYDSTFFLYVGISLINFVTIAAIFKRLDILLWFYGLTFPIIIAALLFFEIYRGYGWVSELFK